MENGGIAPHIRNVDIKWRLVATFTHQLVYHRGTYSVPFGWMLGEHKAGLDVVSRGIKPNRPALW